LPVIDRFTCPYFIILISIFLKINLKIKCKNVSITKIAEKRLSLYNPFSLNHCICPSNKIFAPVQSMLEEMYDAWMRGPPPPPYTDGVPGSALPVNAVLAGKYHL
jgi:hypothetical protein